MGVVAFRGWRFALVALGMGIAGIGGVGCQSAAKVEQPQSVRVARHDPLADGKVIRVDHTEGLAYISLTKADRITQGLTFACFDPRTGVKTQASERRVKVGSETLSVAEMLQPAVGRSTGALEVVEVGEEYSVCRIVSSSKNRKIEAGDLLFNGAFHAMRGKKMRFVIGGGFDLNADGAVTAAEREQLERMIVSWGGQVDPEITVWTNYLILGQFPAEPSIEEKPVVPYGIVDERHNVQNSYASMEAAAKHWAVPVLNQNRALILLGYYAVADRE